MGKWIRWVCRTCGRMNHVQVTQIPAVPAIEVTCQNCGSKLEKMAWQLDTAGNPSGAAYTEGRFRWRCPSCSFTNEGWTRENLETMLMKASCGKCGKARQVAGVEVRRQGPTRPTKT